jgi:hypothetical protein
MHGVHVHGFPNAFLIQFTQGANLISNVPHNLVESAATIAQVVARARDLGAAEVEVTADAEAAWMDLLASGVSFLGSTDCTPGYYNNEGQPTGDQVSWRGYPAGALAFFEFIDRWRAAGTYEGLQFRAVSDDAVLADA